MLVRNVARVLTLLACLLPMTAWAGHRATWPTTQCVLAAAHNDRVPALVILGVMKVEGGKPGQAVRDSNGSYDMGPMQVNSLWLPKLRGLGIDARKLTDNGCTNVAVGTAILALELERAHGNLAKAVGWYHSQTPDLAKHYRDKVRRAITTFLEH